jgi:hypothetical protein
MQAIALKDKDLEHLWLRYDRVNNKFILQKYQLLLHILSEQIIKTS